MKLIFLIGPAGCGKTTYVTELIQRNAEKNITTLVLSRDAIRTMLMGGFLKAYYDMPSFIIKQIETDISTYIANAVTNLAGIFGLYNMKAEDNERTELHLVIDATNLRKEYINAIHPPSDTSILTFKKVFDIDYDTLQEQNEKRAGTQQYVHKMIVKNQYDKFQEFKQTEFFKSIPDYED